MRSRKKNKVLIALGCAFILIGIAGLAFPFLPFWFSADYATLDALAQSQPAPFISSTTSISPTPRPSFDPNRPSIKNRLVMPTADVNMPIFEGTVKALLKGGWIFPNTSTPDKGGNTVIFGHRFRYVPPVSNTFYHLDKVKIGDEFTLAWKGTVYQYRVTDVRVVEPNDFSVIAPSDTPIVTLITCAPLFSTNQRLVVVGELISPASPATF